MSYAILRVERMKRGSVSGIQKHVERENENYSNKDINIEKTKENYSLVSSESSFLKKIDSEIEKRYKSNRKVRTDAIVMLDGIVTSDKNFFNGLDKDEQREYFETSLDFIKNRFCEKNIIYANVHMDEKTPHMHFGVVPMTKEGKLSARDMLNGSRAYRELQDSYYKYVTDKGYDLDRGLPKEVTNNKHKDLEKYKSETLNDLNTDIEKLNHKKKLLDKDLKESLKLKDSDLSKVNGYDNHKVRVVENIDIKPIQDVHKVGLFKNELVNTNKSEINNSDFIFMKNLIKDQGLIINQLRSSNDTLSSIKNFALEYEIQSLKKENKTLKNNIKSLQTQHVVEHEKLAERIKNDYKNEADFYKEEIKTLFEMGNSLAKENDDLKKENSNYKRTLDTVSDFLDKFNLIEKYKTYKQEKEKRKSRSIKRQLNNDYER